jgi:hypothetical protein
VGYSPIALDGGCFGENHSGPAHCKASEVGEMPVNGHSIVRRVLAHRRNDDAILEPQAAQR